MNARPIRISINLRAIFPFLFRSSKCIGQWTALLRNYQVAHQTRETWYPYPRFNEQFSTTYRSSYNFLERKKKKFSYVYFSYVTICSHVNTTMDHWRALRTHLCESPAWSRTRSHGEYPLGESPRSMNPISCVIDQSANRLRLTTRSRAWLKSAIGAIRSDPNRSWEDR